MIVTARPTQLFSGLGLFPDSGVVCGRISPRYTYGWAVSCPLGSMPEVLPTWDQVVGYLRRMGVTLRD